MSILLFRSSNILHQLKKKKNGKEKPLLHGCVCFHVAAVGAILIQLKFQSDKVEFILEITAMLF